MIEEEGSPHVRLLFHASCPYGLALTRARGVWLMDCLHTGNHRPVGFHY